MATTTAKERFQIPKGLELEDKDINVITLTFRDADIAKQVMQT